jgi:vacuolar-type H+-ATPase catalytic subunit A/Vma1
MTSRMPVSSGEQRVVLGEILADVVERAMHEHGFKRWAEAARQRSRTLEQRIEERVLDDLVELRVGDPPLEPAATAAGGGGTMGQSERSRHPRGLPAFRTQTSCHDA